MPPTQPRAAVYVRLSVHRGDDDPSTSPAAQERTCRAYCEARGWEVAEVVRDLDVSGSDRGLRLDRPGLARVRALLPAVQFVVFAKLDRLARNVVDFRAFAEEAEAHGAALVSVAESLDMSTPSGRFVATVLAAFAEQEAAAIASRVSDARAALARLHRWPGGTAPYGYRSAPAPDGPGRVLVVDPAEAAVLTEAAERVVAGETPYAVALDFTARGVPTRRGGQWRPGTLTAALRGDAAVGRLTHRGALVRDDEGVPVQAWPPALDPALWRAVRAALTAPPRASVPRRRAALLLSGLAYCGSCGGPLYVRRSRGRASYACTARGSGRPCPRLVSVRDEWLDDRVTAEFLRAVGRLPVYRIAHVADDAARERLATSEAALDRVMAALRSVDDEEEELALLAQRRALRARIGVLRADSEATEPVPVDTGQTFADLWAATPAPAARRALLSLAGLESVTVYPADSHRPTDLAARRVLLSWRPDYDQPPAD